MDFDNFTGYVLAGGTSSRMKTDKAFLRFGDETFLTRGVKTLETICAHPIKIVLNRTQINFIERFPDQIAYIFDRYENCGALGGIHAALTDCQNEWAIIFAVDLPRVTSEAIKNLAKIACSSKKFAATVPVQTDGRWQPLCAVYRAEDCLPKLESLLKETASASVKDFLKLVSSHFVEHNELTADEEHENLFYNVNEPDEYQLMIRSIE